jgi:hypothetical protein
VRKVTFFGCILLALSVLCMPATSFAQVRVTVAFAPPALPIYEQPICPGDGFIWTPGYWAWDPDFDDYYWVPGTWVLAPEVGFLWTPPWWGWDGAVFVFHEGFWGPHVGFYGGINYGFGYFGFGFVGGRWDGGHFFYNRSVTNINVVKVRNVYNETVVNNKVTVNRVSYNGGAGGVEAHPRPEDEIAARDRHIGATAAQTQHVEQARGNRELRASVNEGKPPIAATGHPGEFSGHGVVAAKEAGAPYHPPVEHGVSAAREENGAPRAIHPNELPPLQHLAAPNTGNTELDQKYQKQQDELFNQQNRERQELQQEQENEHQQMERQNASPAQRQQMEERHQQQTQQMRERHVQEQQRMQERQRPGRPR